MSDITFNGADNLAISSTQHGSADVSGLEHSIETFKKGYAAAVNEKQELIDGLKQAHEAETKALNKMIATKNARIWELEEILEEYQKPSRVGNGGTKRKRQEPVTTKKRKRRVSSLRRELAAFGDSLQASASESLGGVARVTAEVEMLVESVPCVAEDEDRDSGTEHEHHHAFEAIKKSCQAFLRALNVFKDGETRQLSFDAIKKSCQDLKQALNAFEHNDTASESSHSDDDGHKIDNSCEAPRDPRQDGDHRIRGSSPSSASEDEDTQSLDSSEERWCYCHRRDHGTEMVECCEPKCELKWFHLECTFLKELPDDDEPWFCARCRPGRWQAYVDAFNDCWRCPRCGCEIYDEWKEGMDSVRRSRKAPLTCEACSLSYGDTWVSKEPLNKIDEDEMRNVEAEDSADEEVISVDGEPQDSDEEFLDDRSLQEDDMESLDHSDADSVDERCKEGLRDEPLFEWKRELVA